MLPSASSKLPEGKRRAAATPPIWFCTGWGLPSLLRYRRSGELLPRLFTLTCREAGGSFLWHFPEVTFSGCYPAPCPMVFGLSSLAPGKRGYPSRFMCIIRDKRTKNQGKKRSVSRVSMALFARLSASALSERGMCRIRIVSNFSIRLHAS